MFKISLLMLSLLGNGSFVDAQCTNSPQPPISQSLQTDLVALFRFDECTGNTADESTALTADGALSNFPTDGSQWVPGLIGNSLEFRGPSTQDYVNVPSYVKPTSSYTISAWAYADSYSRWGTIVKNWGSTEGQFHLGLDSGNTRMSNYQSTGGGVSNVQSSSSFPLSQWVHVAMVFDASAGTMTLYQDGQSVGTSSASSLGLGNLQPLGIGVKLNNAGTAPDGPNPGYWDGKLDDLAIWARALSATEIECINTEGLNGVSAGDIEDKDLSSGGSGDPHFKTWDQHRYDFHGVCDLVLLQAPEFAHGLGLEIHTRTKARYEYSYIESAAIKIGDDVLEVGSYGEFFYNGIESAEFPVSMGGLFTVTHEQVNKKKHYFEIALDKNTKIRIGSFKDLVSVALPYGSFNQYFEGSVGMLGSSNSSKGAQMLARDGETVLESDPVAFGLEWQVRDTEPSLFQNDQRFPQYPETCVMPSAAAKSTQRRLGEDGITEEQAMTACKTAGRTYDLDACVYDILAMQDLEIAESGAF